MFNYRQFYKDYYHLSFDRNIVIHHIDENRENNEIDNLIAIPNPIHQQYHAIVDDFCSSVNYFNDFKTFFFQLDQHFYLENKKVFLMLDEIYSSIQPWRSLKGHLDIAMRECQRCKVPIWDNINLSYIDDNAKNPIITYNIDNMNSYTADFLEYKIGWI